MIRQSTISLAAIGFLISLLPKAQAQTELNGPTSWDVIGNTFSQPNVTVQVGKGEYEWYGSGDVNNDEKIDSLDLDAMNSGIQNDMSDVDGDGILSTANDSNLLSEFLNGSISYLPGHWNELQTPEERISWLEKMIQINDAISPGDGKGWISSNYTTQMEIEFYGISNIEEFLDLVPVDYESENNARFNIPLYFMPYIHIANGVGHSSGGVLVGREISSDSISFNPLEFKDWYFVGYENDIRIFPGDRMDPNKPVTMYKTAYVESSTGGKRFDTIGPTIEWSLNNGEATLENYNDELLLLENPNIIKVHVGPLEDLVVDGQGYPFNQDWTPEFLEGLGYVAFPEVTTENTSITPTMEYFDSDTNWISPPISYEYNRKFVLFNIFGGDY